MLTRTRLVRPVVAAGLALAVAGGLAGCGSDEGKGDAEESVSPSPSATLRTGPASYLEVPDGVTLTEPGTALDLGEEGVIAFERRQDEVGVLSVVVERIERTSFQESFPGWNVDDATAAARTPYFVRLRLTNVGETDLGGLRLDNVALGRRRQQPRGAELLHRPAAPRVQRRRAARFLRDRRRRRAVPGVLHRARALLRERGLPPVRRPGPGDVERHDQQGDQAGEARQGRQGRQARQEADRYGDRLAVRVVTGLRLGSLEVPTPVVLAPMAGITNAAYRRLCAEHGAGLYVCEMITSRGLVEGDETTKRMLVFDELETVRSVQLYGTDPTYVGQATKILCEEYGVAHVDLNFGCPVPKVTRKGGGGALPWKRNLLGRILEEAVAAAAPYDVPVTMKTRKGLDDDHLTYLDAGRIAQESGVAAIALHGRTVAQAYSGQADWDAIAELVAHVDIPVLGNGDIWEAADAVRMVEETGAAGVVVGRGCLGRPWLFRDLAAAFSDDRAGGTTLPTLGEVRAMMRRHAELLCEHMGEERGCKEFRKHVTWYLKGFRAGGELRRSLGLVDSLAALDDLLAVLDPDEPFPVSELGAPRGRQGAPRHKVVLPEGWLDDTDGLGEGGCGLLEDVDETTGG